MVLWYLASVIAAIAIAWLAAILHLSGHAPIGLLSLGVGVALGATLAAIAATGRSPKGRRVAGREPLIVGTVVLALVTVLAEHAWLYRDFRRQWYEARANSPEVAMFRPEVPWSPGEYFAHKLKPELAALWSLDAALITAAAVGTVLVLNRKRQ